MSDDGRESLVCCGSLSPSLQEIAKSGFAVIGFEFIEQNMPKLPQD